MNAPTTFQAILLTAPYLAVALVAVAGAVIHLISNRGPVIKHWSQE